MEKTVFDGSAVAGLEKHFHGRGEDLQPIISAKMDEETPPRTWRRLILKEVWGESRGNTSTDVEKTKDTPTPVRFV